MKGLAAASSSLAKVNVAGRSARNHYGLNVDTEFIAERHEHGRQSVIILKCQ